MDIRPQRGPQEAFLSTPADIAIYGGSAGGGKALKLDTPILTCDGWKTMGELQAGDYVYGSDGRPCKILMTHPIYMPNKLFELTFDNGETIYADGDHLWKTMTVQERNKAFRRTDEFRFKRRATRPRRGSGKRPDLVKLNEERTVDLMVPPEGQIRSTAEIAATVKIGNRTNHSIPVGEPLQGNLDWPFPFSPYLLGFWLGDGNTGGGQLTIGHKEDLCLVKRDCPRIRKVPSQKYAYRVPNLTTALRRFGLLGHKHIPDWVLRCSIDDRLGVIQGLMDSDGTIRPSGGQEIDLSDELLADGAFKLLSSMGIKVGHSVRETKLNGKRHKDSHRMKFTTTLPVFGVKRKADRQKDVTRTTTKNFYIIAAKEVEPEPVRCITVDAVDSLYRVGRSMIPTHNTFSLLLEPARHIGNPLFSTVTFRRTYPQIAQEGGLWDTSEQVYPLVGGSPVKGDLEWRFPSGATVRFSHMQHEQNKFDWQGSQIPLINFDELTHFTEGQFWYMFSRNRSMCGVRPYIRATTNPDPDSWVANFISWWIDDEGFPISERSGVIRWFVRISGELKWGDSREELVARYGQDEMPKSLTFIPSKITDNPILLKANPEYMANLKALPYVEQQRLLYGNWKVRPAAGKVFNRADFEILEGCPAHGIQCRFWDFAATLKEYKSDDPDYTASVLMQYTAPYWYILDATKDRLDPAGVEALFLSVTRADAERARQKRAQYQARWEIEPGSAGKREAQRLTRLLAGIDAVGRNSRQDKLERARAHAAQVQAHNVKVIKGPWNEMYLSEMHNFPEAKHDDVTDASDGAFNELIKIGGSYHAYN